MLKVFNTGESNYSAIDLADLDLDLLNVLSTYEWTSVH